MMEPEFVVFLLSTTGMIGCCILGYYLGYTDAEKKFKEKINGQG